MQMDHTSTPFVPSYKPLSLSILSTIFPFQSKAKIDLFRLLSNPTNKPVFRLVETFYEFDVEIYVLYPFCKTEPLFGFFNFHRNARFLPFVPLSRRRLTAWGYSPLSPPYQRYTRQAEQSPITLLTLHMKTPRTRHGALRWREEDYLAFRLSLEGSSGLFSVDSSFLSEDSSGFFSAGSSFLSEDALASMVGLASVSTLTLPKWEVSSGK